MFLKAAVAVDRVLDLGELLVELGHFNFHIRLQFLLTRLLLFLLDLFLLCFKLCALPLLLLLLGLVEGNGALPLTFGDLFSLLQPLGHLHLLLVFQLLLHLSHFFLLDIFDRHLQICRLLSQRIFRFLRTKYGH